MSDKEWLTELDDLLNPILRSLFHIEAMLAQMTKPPVVQGPTLDEVKKVTNELLVAGKRDQVVAVLSSYGATCISGLDPEYRSEFLERIKCLR